MSDINIITPPDFLHNKNFSVFLFYHSLYVKAQFQEIISKSKNRFKHENTTTTKIQFHLHIYIGTVLVIAKLNV